ncbi:Gfo/Idh/MocA family protein [Nakamurella endophytica]|uniref:Oxidoreductase n=1 Tax=Nakamurella endophytica TaxID=1748367 RepID=A0A917T237_9ACTN|nr:Gfo/Idh/MocA family oxidoreductase [Nakamurella endophytica]GGM07625.1 oxidoreductase [Nakamurella endophytica]
MRLGLIGLGRIGAFHARTLTALPEVEALVVTDAVPAAVEAVAAALPVETATSPEQLLASGVDGVVIAAATDAHAELLVAAVAAGVPAFCEKPVTRDPADAVAVDELARRRGVAVQIGYPRRFDAAFAAARDAVASGELGSVHTVRSTTLDPAPPPAGYLRTSGGIFRDCAVHDFDAVRFVTGEEVVEVYASGTARGGDPVFAEIGDVHTAATVLVLESGAQAVISNTRYNARGYDVRLEVHGTRDSVAAGLESRLPLRSTEPGTTFPGGTPHTFFMDRLADAFRRELAAFTDVVAGRIPSPCTIADAVAVGWIAEAATRSLAEHRPVTVAEVRDA